MTNISDSLVSTNLIELLRSLSKDEIKEFERFLRSPFLNNRNDVTRLFIRLKKYYPDFKNKYIMKEKLFKKLYPGQEYKDTLMRNLTSHLLSNAENYLAQKNFSEHTFDKEKHLIKALRKKHLDNLFEKNIRDSFLKQDEMFKDEDYFSNMELLETENDFYNETKTQTGKRAEDQLYISRKMRYITNSFLIRMLKMSCLALNEKDIVKFKLDFSAFDYFLEFLKTYKYEDVPLIKLYYNLLLLKLGEEPETRISFILDIIRTYNESFSRHDKYSAYVYICNYYHERISEGEKQYEKQLYFVFKEMASMDICDVMNDYISQQFYINTVIYGLAQKDADWIEDFIIKYKDKISPEFKEHAYKFSLALLNFGKKEFNEALNLISKLQYLDFYYYLRINTLIIRIYYELDYFDELENLINSLKHFLYNDTTAPDYIRQPIFNFLRYTHELNKYKSEGDEYQLCIMKNEIIDNKYVSAKDWLIEKIDEILSKIEAK